MVCSASYMYWTRPGVQCVRVTVFLPCYIFLLSKAVSILALSISWCSVRRKFTNRSRLFVNQTMGQNDYLKCANKNVQGTSPLNCFRCTYKNVQGLFYHSRLFQNTNSDRETNYLVENQERVIKKVDFSREILSI